MPHKDMKHLDGAIIGHINNTQAPKYQVGDKVLKGKKLLTIESVKYGSYSNKYYYTFENYHLWAYENEIKPYQEKTV